jgi:hypothetical protein
MRVEKAPHISARSRDVALKWIKRCLREITRKDYELPVDYATARTDIAIKLKLLGHRSSACARGINIDLTQYEAGHTQILEYPAFARDPVIGSHRCQHPETALAATIAHEVSHFIQYRYGPNTRWLEKKYRKPHGEGFQEIYRILRSRVVNPSM